MKSISRLFVSVATGALCALAGLLFGIIGLILVFAMSLLPDVLSGICLLGVWLFATVVGGLSAFLIRRSTHWPASSIAGAVGACIAVALFMACPAILGSGSLLEGVTKGGLYGARIGVPLGAILGPLGLLQRRRKSNVPEPGEHEH